MNKIETPTLDIMIEIQEQSQLCGEFLDWLLRKYTMFDRKQKRESPFANVINMQKKFITIARENKNADFYLVCHTACNELGNFQWFLKDDPNGEEDNWVPVDLGYSIPEILRIENSPKPPLYFKVNPHYEDTLAFKMPYFDMDYLEKHVRPEFDEISEIIPISPEDYQKSIKYEDVCTSARN